MSYCIGLYLISFILRLRPEVFYKQGQPTPITNLHLSSPMTDIAPNPPGQALVQRRGKSCIIHLWRNGACAQSLIDLIARTLDYAPVAATTLWFHPTHATDRRTCHRPPLQKNTPCGKDAAIGFQSEDWCKFHSSQPKCSSRVGDLNLLFSASAHFGFTNSCCGA